MDKRRDGGRGTARGTARCAAVTGSSSLSETRQADSDGPPLGLLVSGGGRETAVPGGARRAGISQRLPSPGEGVSSSSEAGVPSPPW